MPSGRRPRQTSKRQTKIMRTSGVSWTWSASRPQVRITGARTRFGSCSSQAHICFSWRLMQYPPEAIDYVVVHEMAHLRYMNHGAEFYAFIARYLPDWKTRRALLRA